MWHDLSKNLENREQMWEGRSRLSGKKDVNFMEKLVPKQSIFSTSL